MAPFVGLASDNTVVVFFDTLANGSIASRCFYFQQYVKPIPSHSFSQSPIAHFCLFYFHPKLKTLRNRSLYDPHWWYFFWDADSSCVLFVHLVFTGNEAHLSLCYQIHLMVKLDKESQISKLTIPTPANFSPIHPFSISCKIAVILIWKDWPWCLKGYTWKPQIRYPKFLRHF